MRITRLYYPDSLECGEPVYLSKDTSNHLIRVLRTKTGSPVILFNGDGFDYHGKTLDTNTKNTSLSIDSKIKTNNESNINICLIQGLSRQNRMDTTIQKSVELGVNTIIPVICQRSNLKLNKENTTKKHSHWLKVTVSACEQSGRSILPHLNETLSLETLAPSLDKKALKIILDPTSNTTLKDIDTNQLEKNENKVEVFIGPEGGLNDEEIRYLKDQHFTNICFGPRVLRTETAGPAIISALQLLWGDLG
ncbi:16S rRNA (uracil(1498)-N(3))-methyltransferase [hydrothermal vent metagenome]|uniref:16S rRNA (uracil(1498)-N(3))-methyltransferase n=1 Tax=hydrothermal vent metagenome TaxID=652676 RepID=A0A3B0XHW4_9ZZZZ